MAEEQSFKVRLTTGSTVTEITADNESVMLEIIPEGHSPENLEILVTFDADEVGVLIEALSLFKKRIENGGN